MVHRAFSVQGRQMVYCKPFQNSSTCPINFQGMHDDFFPNTPLPLPYSLSSQTYGYIMLIDCCIIIQAARIQFRCKLGTHATFGGKWVHCAPTSLFQILQIQQVHSDNYPESKVSPQCLLKKGEKVCKSCF